MSSLYCSSLARQCPAAGPPVPSPPTPAAAAAAAAAVPVTPAAPVASSIANPFDAANAVVAALLFCSRGRFGSEAEAEAEAEAADEYKSDE